MSSAVITVNRLIEWREWHAFEEAVYDYFTSAGYEAVSLTRKKVTIKKSKTVPRRRRRRNFSIINIPATPLSPSRYTLSVTTHIYLHTAHKWEGVSDVAELLNKVLKGDCNIRFDMK